jgi:iron complex transport system substrate-binding protein
VLLKADPDLVLTMTRPLVDVMRRHHLPVVFLAWRAPDDVKIAMRLLGEIFDKLAVAERYAAYFDGVVARVATTVTQAGAQRPTVLYLSAATLEQPHLIAEWWITAAGGTSVTNDGRSTESKSSRWSNSLPGIPTCLSSMPRVIGKSLRGTSASGG